MKYRFSKKISIYLPEYTIEIGREEKEFSKEIKQTLETRFAWTDKMIEKMSKIIFLRGEVHLKQLLPDGNLVDIDIQRYEKNYFGHIFYHDETRTQLEKDLAEMIGVDVESIHDRDILAYFKIKENEKSIEEICIICASYGSENMLKFYLKNKELKSIAAIDSIKVANRLHNDQIVKHLAKIGSCNGAALIDSVIVGNEDLVKHFAKNTYIMRNVLEYACVEARSRNFVVIEKFLQKKIKERESS